MGLRDARARFIEALLAGECEARMRILKEGERESAICPGCERRVSIRYEYQVVRLEATGVDVPDVLVGVCTECDEVVSIPAQSTPKLKEAREGKEVVLQAHLPRQLHDVLFLIADRLNAREDSFTPWMLRFYLRELARSHRFAEHVARLARDDLAGGGRTVRRSFRVSRTLLDAAWTGARAAGIRTKADMVKGVIIAAKQDVLEESSARARRRTVEGIAAGA